MQHANFCEHASNAQRTNQNRLLLWILAGNLVELQATSQRQVGSNFRYEVDDAFDLSAPQASQLPVAKPEPKRLGIQVVLKLGK